MKINPDQKALALTAEEASHVVPYQSRAELEKQFPSLKPVLNKRAQVREAFWALWDSQDADFVPYLRAATNDYTVTGRMTFDSGHAAERLLAYAKAHRDQFTLVIDMKAADIWTIVADELRTIKMNPKAKRAAYVAAMLAKMEAAVSATETEMNAEDDIPVPDVFN